MNNLAAALDGPSIIDLHHRTLSAQHDDDDDNGGYPANSHHDKNPPWWEFVSNEYGGNMPVTKSHH